MKKHITLIGTVLLLACTASAQDNFPKIETFLGYDMLRFNSATNIPGFTANGGGGQFVYNVNSWLGAAADVYAAHNGNIFGSVNYLGTTYPGGKIDSTAAFYQFGPRVSIRKWHRFTPFFQILMGAESLAQSIPVTLPEGTTIITSVPGGVFVLCPGCSTNPKNVGLRLKTGQTQFTYLLGGGLDIKLNHYMSFRPIGADLQFSRLQQLREPQPNKSQYSFRYSTGINFTFGGAQ